MGATGQYVLHMDDDMLPSHGAIDQLLANFVLNPDRIVGKFGRALTFGRYYLAGLGGGCNQLQSFLSMRGGHKKNTPFTTTKKPAR